MTEENDGNTIPLPETTEVCSADVDPQPAGTKQSQQTNDETDTIQSDAPTPLALEPSMTMALFVYWIIPVLFITIFGRFLADTTIPSIPLDSPNSQQHRARPQSSPVVVNRPTPSQQQQQQPPTIPISGTAAPTSQTQTQASSTPTLSSIATDSHNPNWPTAYRDTLITIRNRRRHIPGFSGDIHTMFESSTTHSNNSNPPPSSNTLSSKETTTQSKNGGSSITTTTINNSKRRTRPDSDLRYKYQAIIDEMQRDYNEKEPKDLLKGIGLADAMRLYDLQFHEGGTYEHAALDLYNELIHMAQQQRYSQQIRGEATNSNEAVSTINEEVTLDYSLRSIDGVLCGLYTSKGKVCFMANMFERAVEAYSECLEHIDPNYLDAVNARGSSRIVLGKYVEAGRDFWQVIQKDKNRYFLDAFTGMARVLEVKEDVLPDGWTSLVDTTQHLLQLYQQQSDVQPQNKKAIAPALNRLHHLLFTYYDVKAKNYPEAFRHLRISYEHKLSLLPAWEKGSELQKITQTKNIFKNGFWSVPMGSQTTAPIFIVGFVRSGSTLLERILDAHPQIAGTGENSVFNGRLDDIRNQIVESSTNMHHPDGSSVDHVESFQELTARLGDEVVAEMRRRWEIVDANTDHDENSDKGRDKPARFVDKMLTNYYNIGFIEMLFPNALILHVAREPMDTIFSAYKHEFPPGALDYTSDYEGLAELYHAYRDVMEHWDQVLPGRITHIRYEDIVQDFEGMARSIIQAIGLPWDNSVLEFHKKKHAVNTLSSTQVRKGVYKDSLKSWMRYERELQPLVAQIGERVEYNLRTTVTGYKPREAEIQ